MNKAEVFELQEVGRLIAEQVSTLCAELLIEELKEVHIEQSKYSMALTVKDLRTLLMAFEKDAKIKLPISLAYYLWIQTGIRLHGFKPNKTALRHQYGLSLERINELLPGSYKTTNSWRTKS